MADAVAIFTPGQRLVDDQGVPYSGAICEFYLAQTSDPLAVYAASDLTTSLGSVTYTDSAGYPVTAFGGSTKTQVFTGTAPYKIIIKTSAGVTIVTHDNCVGAVVAGSGGGASGITQAQADIRYVRNPNALVLESLIDGADLLSFWDTSAAANKAITYTDIKVNLTTDFRTDGRMAPVGTRQPYNQTTPPAGWTKETGAAYNDAALRFTTGTVSTGGTAGFNATFTSLTPTGTVGNDTPTISKTAVHDHNTQVNFKGSAGSAGLGPASGSDIGSVTFTSTGSGSSAAHNHALTMNAMDFAVKFVEMCIGVKS